MLLAIGEEATKPVCEFMGSLIGCCHGHRISSFTLWHIQPICLCLGTQLPMFKPTRS